jgi:AcrR family transcriptional regulator
MSPESTKQHILLSTIDAIEKHGLANLTTRLIAEEAGVNNAALHYYFGTKENLIDIVLDQTAKHMLDDTKTILYSEAPIETRLTGVLNYLIDGVLNFPNLIRAQLTGPIFYSVRKKDLTSLLSTWVNLVKDAIEPYEINNNFEQLNIKLNMIFSVILMSGLFNNPPGSESWLNFEDPKERDSFTRQAIGMLLNL